MFSRIYMARARALTLRRIGRVNAPTRLWSSTQFSNSYNQSTCFFSKSSIINEKKPANKKINHTLKIILAMATTSIGLCYSQDHIKTYSSSVLLKILNKLDQEKRGEYLLKVPPIILRTMISDVDTFVQVCKALSGHNNLHYNFNTLIRMLGIKHLQELLLKCKNKSTNYLWQLCGCAPIGNLTDLLTLLGKEFLIKNFDLNPMEIFLSPLSMSGKLDLLDFIGINSAKIGFKHYYMNSMIDKISNHQRRDFICKDIGFTRITEMLSEPICHTSLSTILDYLPMVDRAKYIEETPEECLRMVIGKRSLDMQIYEFSQVISRLPSQSQKKFIEKLGPVFFDKAYSFDRFKALFEPACLGLSNWDNLKLVFDYIGKKHVRTLLEQDFFSKPSPYISSPMLIQILKYKNVDEEQVLESQGCKKPSP